MENRQHRFYPDKFGYMLEKSRESNGDNGRGDAVARTVLAAIIYREQRFIDVIYESFADFLHLGKWKPMRHVLEPRTYDFSRDHSIWFVIWVIYFAPLFIRMPLKIPFKLSQKFNQSLDMYLWIRAACRKSWLDRFIYWAVASIYIRTMIYWNNNLRKEAGIKSVHYLDFKVTPEKDLTPHELDARKHSFPSYAVDTLAWMIKCLPDDWFKSRLKRLIPRLVEKSNYLVRMLADDVFDWDDIKGIKLYRGMDAFRWSRRLDVTTDIEMNPLFPHDDQPPYNMDVDCLNANLE